MKVNISKFIQKKKRSREKYKKCLQLTVDVITMIIHCMSKTTFNFAINIFNYNFIITTTLEQQRRTIHTFYNLKQAKKSRPLITLPFHIINIYKKPI